MSAAVPVWSSNLIYSWVSAADQLAEFLASQSYQTQSVPIPLFVTPAIVLLQHFQWCLAATAF